ncbi:MAG TPA: hypothetical protein VJN89_03925 [Candidatus Acidoferrum sp.]|nr:hypothetical protein [Candidatus Acidoferrum sp.]
MPKGKAVRKIKTSIIRIRQEVRRELEEFAAEERRTLGNLSEILLEWGFEQLKAAGSTAQLFHRAVPAPRSPSGNYRRESRS